MSPRICSCVLCGAAVVDWPDTVSWRNQFRGLYSGPEGLVLTGLGLYDDPDGGAFIAPPDPVASWDNHGILDEDQFGANKQRPCNGRHGFIFHGACWALFEKYYEPHSIPHFRLLEVLNSLPFPLESTAIDWGHDYGGLVHILDQCHYPWEDRDVDPDNPDDPEPASVPLCNPYDVGSDIETLLALVATETEESPAGDDKSDEKMPATTSTPDCFNRLPTELCLTIASQLPTSDVLHARLASRTFWSIFYDQHFWASRFWPSSVDRGWLFEVRNPRPLNWMSLYRQTHVSRLSPALQNRRRIWGLMEYMVRILDLRADGLLLPQSSSPTQSLSESSSSPLPSQSILEVAEISPKVKVITASGDLKQLQPDEAFGHFTKGCRTLHKCRIRIPADLVQLSVSTIDVGGTQYIAGVKFAFKAGDVLKVGYDSNHCSADLVEVSRLYGFNVAVESKGIQALQCILADGEISQWAGNLGDSALTERLAHVNCSIAEVELGFDDCKLTSMAIHVPQAQEKTTIGDSTLRTTALWYPEIPPPSMDLNESSFIPPRDKYLSGFEPLVVCHFGGQDGRYLRHLVGITLTGVGDIRRMKFSYDDNDINVSPFGRTRPNDLLYVRDFPINGPGGEVIIAVDGIYCVTERTISLVYCKLTTNRGRLFEIPPTKPQTSYCTTVETMHVDAAAGTAITGFYGAQYPEFGWGMTTLGVISEVKREAGS